MEMSKKMQIQRGFIQHHKAGAGFTLLEIIVSVTIIALIGAVISQAFLTTSHSQIKTETIKEVKQNGDFAVTTMERMIRGASGASVTCTNNTVTFSSLDLGMTTFGCMADNGVMRIASTSALGTNYLTSKAVTIGGSDCPGSTLRISCTRSPGLPTNVNISFTLSQKGSPPGTFEQAQASFETSVTTRN